MSIQHRRARVAGRMALAAAALAAALGAAAADDLKVVTRIEPEFPREALRAGADKGHVKARMTVDGAGEVVRVEILEAEPRRVFDRTVVRTLSQWKFNAGSGGRSMDIDIDFSR